MLTIHEKLKELADMLGSDVIQSPYLLAYMADMEIFRDPEHHPYRQIFRRMISTGHVKQFALQWSSTIPSVSAYITSYPGMEPAELRYAFDCISFALGRIDRISTTTAPDAISQVVNLDDETVEYISHGSSDNIGTLIPAVMASPVHRHLNSIAADEGSVAEYVRNEMIEPTVESVKAKISGEQIDGVALAIRQMTDGKGFVLGDMTGIGKGRQLAMLLKWAQRHGHKPVFVTEKSVLFNDLYRDLKDVGYGDMRPFILNSDSTARITDSFGCVVYGLPTADEIDEFRTQGQIPGGYDFLLMTYSQVNKDSKKSWKPGAVLSAITDNVLILDESHNASGKDSNVGNFFREAVQKAASVCFASATYAKYPSSMPIYSLKTALNNANIPANDLIEIVDHGGPILQEVMAQGLVESGSMIRRQRDMSEVERTLDTPTDAAAVESLRMSYDKVIGLIDDIREFHTKFITPYVKSIPAISKLNSKYTLRPREVWIASECKVYDWKPQTRLAPTIRQLLFAIKTEHAITKTLDELKAGHKPIVQINRTMSSNVARIVKAGESCDNPDFARVLQNCVNDIFHYTVVGKTTRNTGLRNRTSAKIQSYKLDADYTFGDIIAYYNSSEWLNSGIAGADRMAKDAQDCYDTLLHNIRTAVTGLPLSPIDYFIQRIGAEGYTVGELTQRANYFVYDDIASGPNSRITCMVKKNLDKKQLANDFNNGKVDVLIGNRVMASGISLHSSEAFADTRQRTIITWEQQDSADLQTQFDGRADRTGQISHCKYILLASPIPAEKRYLMMNSRKQRSLNANVEANQGRDTLCTDIFNKYGAKVIEEFSNDNPEYAEVLSNSFEPLGNQIAFNSTKGKKPMKSQARGEIVAEFMRNLGLLACSSQDFILSDILSRYNELIDSLESAGENDLQVTVLPLQASLTKRQVFVPGKKHADSPFASDANLDQMEVNVLRKPLTAAEITEQMSQLREDTALIPHIEAATVAKIQNVKQYYSDLRNLALQQLAQLSGNNAYTPSRVRALEERANNTERMNNEIDRISFSTKELITRLGFFKKGRTYAVPATIIPDGQTDDPTLASRIPIGVFMGYNVLNNTYTRSRIQAVFAVNDSRSIVRIPLTDVTKLNTIMAQSSLGVSLRYIGSISLANWDGMISQRNRETAYMITGNILTGIARCKGGRKNIKKSKLAPFVAAMTNGKMVKYTDINGNIRNGYMLSRIFDPKIYFDNIV